jgi:hypothetical protein
MVIGKMFYIMIQKLNNWFKNKTKLNLNRSLMFQNQINQIDLSQFQMFKALRKKMLLVI